jgi:hypothetical protein
MTNKFKFQREVLLCNKKILFDRYESWLVRRIKQDRH